jgi:nitrogenase molybdenum-iron protein alpha/beta subunit
MTPTDIQSSYHIPFTYPFNDGVLLAANAISDLGLIFDGLDCLLLKSERIYNNHDWQSSLLNIDKHRVVNTLSSLSELAMGEAKNIRRLIADMQSQAHINGLMVSASSKVVLTDPDYDAIQSDSDATVPFFSLKTGDFRDDWLSGYAAATLEIARKLPLDTNCTPKPRSVAIIGYLMDRLEGDHRGNIEEIRELLAGLDLDCCSIWLSGGSLDELAAVAQAETILSMPYAREAANHLSARLGRPLVELSLPIGLDATARWLRILGKHFNRAEAAERLITEGERSALTAVKSAVEPWLQGKRYIMVADPFLIAAASESLAVFGMEPIHLFATTTRSKEELIELNLPDVPLDVDPTSQGIRHFLENCGPEDLDLIITCTQQYAATFRKRFPTVEFGVPCFFSHDFVSRPFMGYNGVTGMIERIVSRMTYFSYIFGTE